MPPKLWPAVFAAVVAASAASAQTSVPEPVSTLKAAPALRASPGLREHLQTDANVLPVFTEADRIEGDTDSQVTLTGNAQLRRSDVVLKGSRIHYDKTAETLEAEGDVRLLRGGNLVTGPRLKFNLGNDTGVIDDAQFQVAATGGTGKAQEAEFLSRTQVRLMDATYSGCPCPTPDWWIKARQVDLDFDENEGLAYSGVLYFKGVPILGAPVFSFPVTSDRKSGFLPPTLGITSKGGVQVLTPYYFNLAPNYDATVYTNVMARRGVQLGGQFRYLQPSYSGEVQGTWINNDRPTGEQRWYYRAQHRQSLPGGLGLSWDLQRASDDDYFRDFTMVALDRASTVTLPQSVNLGWANEYFSANLNPIKYQTLQDPSSPITPPYDMLPRFTVNGNRYNWGGFDLNLAAEATRFRRSDWFAGSQRIQGEEGTRMSSYQSISWPVVRAAWFFTPKVGLHATRYQTDFDRSLTYQTSTGQFYANDVARRASRVLPIASLDSGLIFERSSSIFGRAATQTLEPRLYYLYVPYRDQSHLPVYDTALSDFNFAQAFSENMFAGGWDRIANANQVTMALTSRWIDEQSGVERARVSAAQRVYFTDQLVSLPGERPRNNERSDLLFEVYGALTNTLSAQASVQYNQYIKRFEQSTVTARWDAARLATLYGAYRYQRPSYLQQGQEQVSMAFQWPLAPRWYGVARADYSMQDSRFSQVLGGIEYNGGCCWTARMVGQRYAVSADSANTAFFFQLELTGLARVGNNPVEVMRRNIPGYQVVSRPVVPTTAFDRYE